MFLLIAIFEEDDLSCVVKRTVISSQTFQRVCKNGTLCTQISQPQLLDHFSKNLNILLLLSEFIEVGKPARALDTLQEVFRNKKFSYTWSEQVIEPIMFKYLDLCVELKKSHIAKEGLFQYRNMFQLVSNNMQSIHCCS